MTGIVTSESPIRLYGKQDWQEYCNKSLYNGSLPSDNIWCSSVASYVSLQKLFPAELCFICLFSQRSNLLSLGKLCFCRKCSIKDNSKSFSVISLAARPKNKALTDKSMMKFMQVLTIQCLKVAIWKFLHYFLNIRLTMLLTKHFM